MRDMFGGLYPALIWRDVMMTVHEDMEPTGFEVPRGIVSMSIDIKSGLLPSPETPSNMIRREVFVEGTQPVQVSNAWTSVAVSSQYPDYLFDPACHHCEPETRVFLNRERVEPHTNPKRQQIILPADMALMAPQEYCSVAHPHQPIMPGPGNGNDEPPGTGDPDDPAPPEPVSATILDQGGRLRRLGDDGLLGVPAVVARPGAEITLTIRAVEGDILFLLPYLELEQLVVEGEERTLVFTINREGLYDFYCGLSWPAQDGMRGRVSIRD